MVARSILARRLRQSAPAFSFARGRFAATAAAPKPQPLNSAPETQTPPPPRRPQSWLTKKLEGSPAAKSAFLKMATLLGYGSAKQVAGRRAFAMYEQLCVPKPDEDTDFWQHECHLPPTFQSWFTVVNLHIWLLTVRLRALPPPHGMHHVQALIDHFFLDVEDRVRAVLQPASPNSLTPQSPLGPYTTPTTFYSIANPSIPRPRGRAPERLVTQQMKIFKEQWTGMGMSFDVALLRGDADMAGAVWRNFLGARGARGIVYPSASVSEDETQYFRRTINLEGGEVEKVKTVAKRGLEVEEARDDGSGVHDYAPRDADKYVAYPELMAALVVYARRELMRLDSLPDEAIMGPAVVGREGEGVRNLKFGRVRDARTV
ncbi:hypothetical protein B0H21DRAFT_575531 [Amylocystis lapponica]|nr:hypothetical protein B0H21DRAFT_575531 [Amylocystis lapponica]